MCRLSADPPPERREMAISGRLLASPRARERRETGKELRGDKEKRRLRKVVAVVAVVVVVVVVVVDLGSTFDPRGCFLDLGREGAG